MIGIFDSGVGGLNSCYEIKRLLPRESLVYLADKKNCPYGTKNKDNLIKIVKHNLKRLTDMGAEVVLIACCTASGVYPYLSESEKSVAIPIIEPTARQAAQFKSVAVISTELTAASHFFGNAIRAFNRNVTVTEIPTQILVSLVELGARDGALLPREELLLDGIASVIKRTGAEALVLGCTHFSHLEAEFAKRLDLKILSPARLGAAHLAELLSKSAPHTAEMENNRKHVNKSIMPAAVSSFLDVGNGKIYFTT